MTISEVFFDEDFDTLNNTIRWNGLSRITNETVAHHSYMVTLFTRLIAETIWQDHPVKILQATTYAIFHDHDEMFTGDILHGFKHNDFNGDVVRAAAEKYVDANSMRKFLPKGGCDAVSQLLYKNITGELPTDVKTVVKIADWLSMLFYLYKEFRLGNKNLNKKLDYCIAKTTDYFYTNVCYNNEFSLDQSRAMQTVITEIQNKIHY